MDKFLSICFKFGKIFTVILLVTFLLSMISAGIYSLTTFKKVDLNIPTFSEMYANIEAVKNSKTTADNAQVEPYILLINDISKKYLSDYGKKMLTRNVKDIDYDYRIEYLRGFEQALKDTIDFAQLKKMNERQANEILESIINNYDSYFNRNIQRKNMQELKLKTERIIALSTLSSSILLFILCLIIPLLIKIEENTRNIASNNKD